MERYIHLCKVEGRKLIQRGAVKNERFLQPLFSGNSYQLPPSVAGSSAYATSASAREI